MKPWSFCNKWFIITYSTGNSSLLKNEKRTAGPNFCLFWNCSANRNCLNPLWGHIEPILISCVNSGLVLSDPGRGLLRPLRSCEWDILCQKLTVRILCSQAIGVSDLPPTSWLCGFKNPKQEFFWNSCCKSLSLAGLTPKGYLWQDNLA